MKISSPLSICFGRVKEPCHLFAQYQFRYKHKILNSSKEKYAPASNRRSSKTEQRINHAHKQQIVSSGLCAMKHFVAFLLTEQTGQSVAKTE